MKMIPVDSSMLQAIGYDAKKKELEVVFTSGAVWRYEDVPKKVYQGLLESDSKGSYMRGNILGVYPEYQVRRR